MLTHTGVKLIFDPLANPKMMQNVIVRAKIVLGEEEVLEEERIVAGSQRQNEDSTQRDSARSMALNRPILSARSPGSQRPIAEPALRMAMIW